MATNFAVQSKDFADNLTDSAFATAVEAWLDGLSITVTTNYGLSMIHFKGFIRVTLVYA